MQSKFIEDVRQALYASKIIAYAQGFNQIQAGSAEYDWDITPGDMATIWRGGCIIRAKFLNRIKEAFDEDPNLPTLIVAPYFRSAIEAAIDSWRRVVVAATQLGIPIPGFSSSLSVLRRAAHRAAARGADPGPARLLRRAHLRPHRRRPEPRSSTPCGAGTAARCLPNRADHPQTPPRTGHEAAHPPRSRLRWAGVEARVGLRRCQ